MQSDASSFLPNSKVSMLIDVVNNRRREDLVGAEFNEVEANAILEMPLAPEFCDDIGISTVMGSIYLRVGIDSYPPNLNDSYLED